MTARVAVLLHVGELVVGAPLAVLSAIEPVNRTLLYVAIAGFTAWVAAYAPIVWRRGFVAPVVIVDIVVTVALCLINSSISPAERVDEGSGWVATIASMATISVALAWPARVAIPAGLVIIAAFQAGFLVGGLADRGGNHTVIMVIQLVSAVYVMRVLRRVDAAEMAAVAAERSSRQAAEVLDTFVYFNSIATQQFGYGAAAGLFKGVVGLLLILIANTVAHKLGEAGVYSKS